MPEALVTWPHAIAIAFAVAACGSSGASCDLPEQWSTANSGGLCQANIFGDTEYAVYCARNADGDYDCACGAAADDPLEFISPDFCDLEDEERVCEAIARCNFPF
jgi:hypothetical protein